MRALFVTVPARVHALPVVPLAWALRALGHEVLVATADEGGAVAEAGLAVADVSPELDLLAYYGQPVLRRHPEFTERRAPSDEDFAVLCEMLGDINAHLAEPVLAVAGHWRPDFVVYEGSAPVGALAAAVLGVPAVRLGIRVERWPAMAERIGAKLAAAARSRGVVLPPDAATISMTPPSVLPALDGEVPMRCVPFNGGSVVSEPPKTARPVVAVTMGATWSTLGLIGSLVRAASEVDAEFVLALGEQDLAPLGALPSNVHSAGWLPLTELLPHCAAVVHHGGCGTAFTALAHGVPQLIVPAGITHYATAEVLRERGVALVGTGDHVDSALLKEILAADAQRAAAAEVRAEITAMPAPAEVAARLTELVQA
ncbi:UDP:flavonoid glycosyltransferase YjiC, YdhE family [Amycolatopsis xylanica]|uniref:UDP:flavonoid glycosyltransferase YjiC, YdhE family n=1 Tax=Amycolatopsis xylanica TaxID=589385 RepID=A0A1H2VQA5_9PSEU|nr:nucleotide disphospho-sugar-binding domain-containing protein [Amycolatopsis xylanica]SDW70496.1 UDP:flavonoid glycosyltransferase YjiC, YdhE family [Amycolatopsis xylanica]